MFFARCGGLDLTVYEKGCAIATWTAVRLNDEVCVILKGFEKPGDREESVFGFCRVRGFATEAP